MCVCVVCVKRQEEWWRSVRSGVWRMGRKEEDEREEKKVEKKKWGEPSEGRR